MVLKSSMQLDQIIAFDRIAREGTFSRAAHALGLGQPAVSARILALEEAIGGSLFVRGRTLRLTALGESFLPYARRALEVLREGAEASRLARPLLRLRWWQSHDPRISRLAEQSETSVEVAMETGRRLVASGVGAGFFARTYIAEELARGTLTEVPVRGLALVRDSALVRRRHSGPISPALAAFIDLLRRRTLQPDNPTRLKPARKRSA